MGLSYVITFALCINGNIVECKANPLSEKFFVNSVLIETSWNVKTTPVTFLCICLNVLIETSWNVKKPMRKFHFNVQRINRNIVECKVIYNILYCFNTSY